jgi:hypothetical protein
VWPQETFGFQPNVKHDHTTYGFTGRCSAIGIRKRFDAFEPKTPTFMPVFSFSAALTALETLTIITFALSLNADNHQQKRLCPHNLVKSPHFGAFERFSEKYFPWETKEIDGS